MHNSFISSRGYGFVLHNPELSRWRLADERADAWQVDVAGSALDYTVAPGGVRRAVGAVSALNGRHRMPPAWAQGTTLYRGVKVLSADTDTPGSYAAKVRADLRRIDRDDLDITAYGIEGWALLPRLVLRMKMTSALRPRIMTSNTMRGSTTCGQSCSAAGWP